MGTTLTGTTPQDTYDSLIKVTDNGPISGTAKYLSDGLGNDSALALSTNAVGIGTSAPTRPLEVQSNASANAIAMRARTQDDYSFIQFLNNAGGTTLGEIFNFRSGTGIGLLGFSTANGAGPVERVILSADGYLRLTANTGGLQFNGDTAAANALDDYEEGTFTPTIIGSATAGTATYGGGQAGSYTKIGRMVYFNIYLGYSGGTGTGDLRIAGLPFTIASADIPSFSIGTFLNVALTASNVPITSGVGNSTQVRFEQIPTGGGTQTAVPYDDTAVIAVSGCYQV